MEPEETNDYQGTQIRSKRMAGLTNLSIQDVLAVIGQQAFSDLEPNEVQFIHHDVAVPLARKHRRDDFADWISEQYGLSDLESYYLRLDGR